MTFRFPAWLPWLFLGLAAADLIAVDFSQAESQPVYNPISQLVYATQASQVTHSWVAGNALMRDRQFSQLDLPDIIARAKVWGQTIDEGKRTS